MQSLKIFNWVDGNYDIMLEQHASDFYCITARCSRRGEVVFAATKSTSSACQEYIYERIHC